MFYRKRNTELELEVNPVLKYSLFLFSTIYWLLGLGLILVGIYACAEKGIIFDDFSSLITDPAIIILCIGSSIFFVTFFACVGSLRENAFQLKFFSVTLTVSLVIQVTLGIVVICLSNQVEELVKDYFSIMIISYRDDPDRQNIIDWGQEHFECCGASGYRDWDVNMYFYCSPSNPSFERCSVPWSCCVKSSGIVNTLCGVGVMELDTIDVGKHVYTTGCVHALVMWLHDHMFILAFTAVGLALPQIIGICIARILLLQINDKEFYTKMRKKTLLCDDDNM